MSHKIHLVHTISIACNQEPKACFNFNWSEPVHYTNRANLYWLIENWLYGLAEDGKTWRRRKKTVVKSPTPSNIINRMFSCTAAKPINICNRIFSLFLLLTCDQNSKDFSNRWTVEHHEKFDENRFTWHFMYKKHACVCFVWRVNKKRKKKINYRFTAEQKFSEH